MDNKLREALDAIVDRQAERHSWISRAAAQIEQWKREEAEADGRIEKFLKGGAA